ncbi:Flavin reductase like domain-containing protein [Entamoeba marina]
MNTSPIDKSFAIRLINHGCTVMMTAYDDENKRATGMTAQWSMPLNENTICIKFGAMSHTCKCLLQTKKFVLNIPVRGMLDQVKYFGSCHGNNVNKFKESSLHLKKCNTDSFGELVIDEAIGHVELELNKFIEFDDHSKLVFGNVVSCSVAPNYYNKSECCYTFSSNTPENDLTIHHYGSTNYGVSIPF